MSSTPGFDFIASPIQRLFSSHSTTLMGILKVLSVLAIRFRQTYVHTAQMDWNMPFDVDTSSIQGLFDSTSSYDFVRLRTNSDGKAFASLSPEGVIANDSLTRQYLANWEKLVSSVFECCSALPDRIEYIQECVQVSLHLWRGTHLRSHQLNGTSNPIDAATVPFQQPKLPLRNVDPHRPPEIQCHILDTEQHHQWTRDGDAQRCRSARILLPHQSLG